MSPCSGARRPAVPSVLRFHGLGEPIDRVCNIYSKSSGKPIENPVNVCLRTGELVILDDDDARGLKQR